MAAAGNNLVFVLPKPTPDLTVKHQQHQQIYADPNTAVYSAPAKFGGTPTQLKPPKRLRKDNDPITRCKRRLDFARLGLPGMQKQNPVIAARRNERERNRVKHINDTFTVLRDHLPSNYNVTVSKINKEMSKVEILRAAIDYIQTLEEMLAGKLQITGDVDLKALIQASTSPDSKSPGFDKDMVKKLLNGSQSREDVSTPSSVFSNESMSDSAISDNFSQQQLSNVLEQLVQASSIGELKNPSFPNATNSFISNDLNANEVKPFSNFMDHRPDRDQVQHNQISQSHQYDTIKLECGLLSKESIQHTPHNVQTNAQTVTGQIQDSTQSQVINNGTINVNIGAAGQFPNVPSASSYGPGFGQNSTLFDGLDLAEVDFTSLLMGCDSNLGPL